MIFGTWCLIPSPEVVSALSQNLDFVILDREHGTASYSDIYNMIAAAKREDTYAFVRVSSNNESEILHSLDCGADGIIIPHVQTVEDVEKFIKYTSYPPMGERGYTPFVYSGSYGRVKNQENFKKETNEALIRGIIIEDEEGVRNLPYIVRMDIDLIYIGVYDLSISLGLPINAPKIKQICKEIAKEVRSNKKSLGAIFSNKKDLNFLQELDVDFGCYKTDTAILFDSTEEVISW